MAALLLFRFFIGSLVVTIWQRKCVSTHVARCMSMLDKNRGNAIAIKGLNTENVSRCFVLFSITLFSLETAARSLKVVPIMAPVHSDGEIETAIIALGREPEGGLVSMPDIFMVAHRAQIILAAARNNVPAVYHLSTFARDGGLLSYGIDQVDIYRRAASYVDRILRGAKPGDLPVQFPTKFEMVVNLKTAKALGLAVSRSIRLRADEVIE